MRKNWAIIYSENWLLWTSRDRDFLPPSTAVYMRKLSIFFFFSFFFQKILPSSAPTEPIGLKF